MRIASLATLLLASVSLGACATAYKPPEISYDDTPKPAVLQPDPPKPVQIVELPKPLPLPGQLKPLPSGRSAPPEAADPHVRVDRANGAARVQPTQAGYLNAIQVYPFSDGALYQVYAAPGEITSGSRDAATSTYDKILWAFLLMGRSFHAQGFPACPNLSWIRVLQCHSQRERTVSASCRCVACCFDR